MRKCGKTYVYGEIPSAPKVRWWVSALPQPTLLLLLGALKLKQIVKHSDDITPQLHHDLSLTCDMGRS